MTISKEIVKILFFVMIFITLSFGASEEEIQNSDDISFLEKENSTNYLESLLSSNPLNINLSKEEEIKKFELIKLLIANGADLGKASKNNKNSFEKIVFDHILPKDLETFAFTFPNPNKKYFIKGRNTHWTPLFGAISTQNIEAVEKLLENKADINYIDEDGLDAFYLAVYSRQIDVAKKLVKNGFKPNLTPKGARHPLAIAVLNNDIKMIEYLQTLGYDIHKELFGKKNLLEFALTNPNKDINREKYPFFINFEMYKYLIDSFKNELNNPKELGYHNLLLTKNGKDSFEAFKYLLQMDIDINKYNNGYSPLQFINYYDEYMMQKIGLLLKQKININHQDKDGDTPLHEFVLNYIVIQNQKNEKEENKNTDINSILLLAGIVQKDMKQEYIRQIKQAIKYLIDNGANNKIKNKQNKKAYDLAIDGKVDDNELLGWIK